VAHPSSKYLKSSYVIETDTTNGRPSTGYFSAITCNVAGNVIVRGSGLFGFADADGSPTGWVAYIDPSTGKRFADADALLAAGDGYYEFVPTINVGLTMVSGQTIYGRWTSVSSDGTFTGFAFTE
jgi:hypothetical protein